MYIYVRKHRYSMSRPFSDSLMCLSGDYHREVFILFLKKVLYLHNVLLFFIILCCSCCAFGCLFVLLHIRIIKKRIKYRRSLECKKLNETWECNCIFPNSNPLGNSLRANTWRQHRCLSLHSPSRIHTRHTAAHRRQEHRMWVFVREGEKHHDHQKHSPGSWAEVSTTDGLSQEGRRSFYIRLDDHRLPDCTCRRTYR